ncbi:MAG: glycosyltransferase family 2 protein [Bacilli bacterium]|nr:glycosyltransferase family 2 protein [Bacilli bacterium]
MEKNKFTVDVIIAAYNSHESIIKALASLSIQKINFPLNIIVVDDGSKCDYKNEIDFFKSTLNVKEVKLSKNSGAGVAKQFGLDNSNGDFVLFLDSDDVLFDSHSLQGLYNLVSDGDCDYAYGAVIFEEDGFRNILRGHDGCLHGKLYSRNLIQNNSIKFNTTRTSEDNSFNHLCLFNAKNIRNTQDVVYIYKDNKNTLTKGISVSKEIDNLIDYIDNIFYTVDNLDDKTNIDVLKYYVFCVNYAERQYRKIAETNPEEANRIIDKLKELKDKTFYYSDSLLNEVKSMMQF